MRGYLLAIVLVATAGLSAALISAAQPAVYRATTSWALAPDPGQSDVQATLRLLQAMSRQPELPQTIARAAESATLSDRARVLAGVGSGATVSVRARSGSWILDFAAEAESPAAAASLARAAAAVAATWAQQAYPAVVLTEIEPARESPVAAGPEVMRDGLAGVIAGIAVVLAWPWLAAAVGALRERLAGLP